MKKLLLAGLLLPFLSYAMEPSALNLQLQVNHLAAPFRPFFFTGDTPFLNHFINYSPAQTQTLSEHMNQAIQELIKLKQTHYTFIQTHPKLLKIINTTGLSLVKVHEYLIMEILFRTGPGEEPPVRESTARRQLFMENE